MVINTDDFFKPKTEWEGIKELSLYLPRWFNKFNDPLVLISILLSKLPKIILDILNN